MEGGGRRRDPRPLAASAAPDVVPGSARGGRERCRERRRCGAATCFLRPPDGASSCEPVHPEEGKLRQQPVRQHVCERPGAGALRKGCAEAPSTAGETELWAAAEAQLHGAWGCHGEPKARRSQYRGRLCTPRSAPGRKCAEADGPDGSHGFLAVHGSPGNGPFGPFGRDGTRRISGSAAGVALCPLRRPCSGCCQRHLHKLLQHRTWRGCRANPSTSRCRRACS
mmetsp:Transcript_41342/g.98040  ORF Transcript_41342/g.98040 Transcript_41342/m.98040 type:complete len:225 (+) Transcript_41342:274-948(+)